MVGDLTLLELLQQRRLVFFVNEAAWYLRELESSYRLPPPFSYPYGTNHFWDLDRYLKDIPANAVSLCLPRLSSSTDFFFSSPQFLFHDLCFSSTSPAFHSVFLSNRLLLHNPD